MEEKTVNGKDVIKLLLGNKWLYLIMVAAFFAVGFVGFNMYSASRKEYVSFFDYDIAGFQTATEEDSNAYYIDGEKFDPRSLVTKDKMAKYVGNNLDLLSLNAEELYKSNTVKSFSYVTRYKENDHKMDDNDASFIADKKGFELVLNTYTLNERQAKVLAEAIAYEAIEISKEKVNNLNFSQFIYAYDETNNYPNKIQNLIDGVAYIENLASSLDDRYGDFIIAEGRYGGEDDNYYVTNQTISDWRNKMKIKFGSFYLSSLQNELYVNGYIDPNDTDYIISLKTDVENLNREINNNQLLLDDLKSQRNDLVAAVGTNATIESLEIREYNTEIISLSTLISQQKDSLAIYQTQLEKLDLSTMTQEEKDAYNTNLTAFESKLTQIRNSLEIYTKQYEAIAKKAMIDNMKVYFENADLVTLTGSVGLTAILGGSLAIALVCPMIVNLAIAGFNVAEGKPILKLKKKENAPED